MQLVINVENAQIGIRLLGDFCPCVLLSLGNFRAFIEHILSAFHSKVCMLSFFIKLNLKYDFEVQYEGSSWEK